MGKHSVISKSIPAPEFKSLRALDRYRKLCLWLPVTIGGSRPPWGYKIDPSNPLMALPDEKALQCWIKAHEYAKGHSYQVISEWLESCGFPIGDWGLMKIFLDRPNWPELKLPIEERMKL